MRRGSGKRTARSAECHYCRDGDCGRPGRSPPPPFLPKELLGTNPVTEQAGPHLSLLREIHLGSSTLRCPSDKDKCQGRRRDHEGGKCVGQGWGARSSAKHRVQRPYSEAGGGGRALSPSGEKSRELWGGGGELGWGETSGLEGAAAC